MRPTPPPPGRWSLGRVQANAAVSSGLLRLDVRLDGPAEFLPGQFAMLNLTGAETFVFGRPFSILEAVGETMSFLYRVVGQGTRALAALATGANLSVLGPLGTPFPPPDETTPSLLLAGGVGLPPLFAWWLRNGGDHDLAFFGGRDGGDVPWSLLPRSWQVSVDRGDHVPPGRDAFVGLVTELARDRLAGDDTQRRILACGPRPLLAAAAAWAAERSWDCRVSVEERMGCGYGVCKGCVVPVRDPRQPVGWRNATCCQEGPVFAASHIDWQRWRPAVPTGPDPGPSVGATAKRGGAR